MYLEPCSIHCHLAKKCARKKKLQYAAKRLKLGLTSARVKCSRMFDGFPVGARVSTTIKLLTRDFQDVYEGGCIMGTESEDTWEAEDFTGTITRHDGVRCMVWLDEPIEDDLKDVPRQRIRIYPGNLHLLDEPPVKVCLCGRPENRENEEGWNCDMCANGIPEAAEPCYESEIW